jgi:hypothetical protein
MNKLSARRLIIILYTFIIAFILISCNEPTNHQSVKYSGLAISFADLSAFGMDSVCHVSLHGEKSDWDTIIHTNETIIVNLKDNYFEISAFVDGSSVNRRFNKDSTKLIMLQYQYWPCDLYRDSIVSDGISSSDSIQLRQMYSANGGCFTRPKELDCFLVQ